MDNKQTTDRRSSHGGWGERIRAMRKSLGLSQAAFAAEMRTSQPSISRWEKEIDEPLAHNWDRMAEISGMSAAFLRYGTDPLTPIALRSVKVRGYVQAGAWREALEWPESEWYDAPMPSEDARYPGMQTFGLEVRGTSMNRLYPEGTVLSCINLVVHPVTVHNGQKVIVQRISRTGDVECTVKEYHRDDTGRVWLWPRSDDPEYQAPIRGDDGDEVRIVALVVRSSRPE